MGLGFSKDIYDSEGNDYIIDYYDTEILPSGNTIKILFQEEQEYRKYYYNIYLVTAHKKKQEYNTRLKSTGKDGLKGLFWARDKIKEFEDFIKLEKIQRHGSIITIFCHWDDNRRRRVYEYGLKPLGYKMEKLFNKKVLVKRFKIQ